MPDEPAPHDAAVALLRAVVDEIRAVAHNPTLVHAAASKMKDGIDALERALTDEPKQEQKQEQRK